MRRFLVGLVVAVAGLVMTGVAGAAPSGLSLATSAQLVPSGTGENFGSTQVAGGYVFATAALASGPAGFEQGAVFVFAPEGSAPGATLHEVAQLTPGAGSGGDTFGGALAVTSDGSQVFVAGGFSTPQPVYAFSMPAGGWSGTLTPSAELVADPGAASGFGASLAVDGQTVVVGAPGSSAAYVFEPAADGWTGTISPAARLTSTGPDVIDDSAAQFGTTVEVAGDTVLVEDGLAEDSSKPPGSADVFVEPASGWHDMTESAKLVATPGDVLLVAPSSGANLAPSGDTIAISESVGLRESTDSGALAVFTRPPDGWNGTVQPSDTLLMSDGSIPTEPIVGTDAIFAAGDGAEQVFAELPGGWNGSQTATASLSVPVTTGLPNPVTVSGDEVLIGGSLSGTLAAALQTSYLFTRPAEGWSGPQSPTAVLTAPGGALQPPVPAPQAAAFIEPDSGWASASPSAVLAPSGNPQQVVFGAVAVSGSTVVATPGINYADYGPVQGPLYVFVKPSAGWRTAIESATLTDSAGDQLGTGTVSGPTVVAPAGGHLDVFREPAGGWKGAIQEDATLSDSDGVPLTTAAISGATAVSGDDVFAEPATGWNGSGTQTARLSLPSGLPNIRAEAISGTTIVVDCANARDTRARLAVYLQPALGWQGTISPAAVLTPQWAHTDGNLVAIDGRDIAALDDGTGKGSRTDIAVYVEPEHGWSGQLTPTAITDAGYTGGYEVGEVSASLAIRHGLIATNPVTEDHYMDVAGGLTIDPPPIRGWGHGPVPAPITPGTGETGTVALSNRNVFDAGDGVTVSSLTGSGPPSVSPLSITHASRHIRLAVTVSRGINATAIRTTTITLPAGLGLVTAHRGISVIGTHDPKIMTQPHRLTVTLRRPATQITIKLTAPALTGSTPQARTPPTTKLRVTDAHGLTTILSTPALPQQPGE